MTQARTKTGRGSGGRPPGKHSLELTGKESRS
jgi:hypothetical protein